MAGFEEEVVRAYFETNGFLVRLAGRPPEAGKKRAGTVPTLAIFNPEVTENATDFSFRLYTTDVGKIRTALVSILGWESRGFSANFLRSDAGLLKFIKAEVTAKRLESGFSPPVSLPEARMGDCLRLLVLPALPHAEGKIREALDVIREAGVQGIYTFSVMLENLLRRTEPNSDHAKSVPLQALRILKAYGLAKEPQLEMFSE